MANIEPVYISMGCIFLTTLMNVLAVNIPNWKNKLINSNFPFLYFF